MIHSLMLDLQERMRALKYPVDFIYGPVRFLPVVGTSGVIILERDPEVKDGIAPAAGKANTADRPRVWDRNLSCRATIYAQSTLDGAGRHDHERVCEQFVDAFVCALHWWAVHPDVRAKLPVPYAMGYVASVDLVDDDERAAFEAWPGVAYRVAFPVARGVRDATYEAEPRPTGTPASLDNRTDVTGPGVSIPEIGCGA